VRAQHDPQHDLVEAHFTLMFPMTGVSLTTLAGHVDRIAKRSRAVDFRLTQARAVQDRLAPRSHVFLIPDEGDAEIRELHSALYGGDFASSLRADIPYLPHVTVAVFPTQPAAEAMAHELGEFQIKGCLRAMALLSVHSGAVRREAMFPLI
jgi:2'-5' RNA ligase